MSHAKKNGSTINYEVLQERLFNRIHRTGEEIKNDFPNVLRAAIKSQAWKHFKKIDGSTFKNLGEWLTYAFPNGVSMGSDRHSIGYDDAVQLCQGDKELHGLLVKHRPDKRLRSFRDMAARNEAAKDGEIGTADNIRSTIARQRGGTSRAAIEARLQRYYPKIYADYIAGKIKSARQAGIKAGFLKDSHDPLQRLKSNWKKSSKEQRAEFKKWLRTKEAKGEAT